MDFVAQTPDPRSAQHIRGSHSSLRYLQIALAHVWRNSCISAQLSVWRDERDERDNREPWDTARPSRNTSNATFSMIYVCARIREGASGRSVLITPRAFASFLYGYCSVAYRHPRSAPTLDNCNTQRWAAITGGGWNSSTVPRFCAAPDVFIWLR